MCVHLTQHTVSLDLIISDRQSKVDIALLRDKQLIELHEERGNIAFQVGDIYLGKVQRVMPGLNAAFVAVGHEKDAFLHYLDLGPQFKSQQRFCELYRAKKLNNPGLERFRNEAEIPKDGKIGDVLKPGMEVLVQIAKEPISTKGPRVTSEISLAGRYVVLVPFQDRVSVSQKIRTNEERSRLRDAVTAVKPQNYGVIVRTVAEGKKVEEIENDLRDLVNRWKSIIEGMASVSAPAKVIGEMSRTSTILRDMLNSEFNSIVVDSQQLHEEVQQYLRNKAPEKESLLRLHKGKPELFEHLGITKQIKSAFGKHVTIKNGAYLVIEHTEAMHVIDVNSGPRTNKDQDQETNALDVNLEAAREVARQLRLRDMGGIIVVDFIDLGDPENRKKLFDKLRDEMSTDRARHNILPPTKFGLIQITRQRVRPEMSVKTLEKCPTCGGSGEVEPTVLFEDGLENNIAYILQQQNEGSLTVQVHPYIGGYLTKGLFSPVRRWMFKYRKRIHIETSAELQFLEYHFLNSRGEEIRI